MEDVTMINIICDEDIIKEFENFNIKIEDMKILEKLKNLCLINDITADNLVSEWLGFCSKKEFTDELNLTKLDLFEKEDFRKKVIQLEKSAIETKFKNEKLLQIEDDILSDYGLGDFKPLSFKPKKNENDLDESNNKHNQSGLDECILENTLNESVELNDDNKVQLTFGIKLNTRQWINVELGKFDLKPLNPDFHISKPFKTLQIQVHECNQILNDAIDEMLENIRKKLQLLDTAHLEKKNSNYDYFVGRILTDVVNDKNEKSFFFQNPFENMNKVPLDLSNLDEYHLFSGKIVALLGSIENENLIVKEFLYEKLNIPSFSKNPIKINNPLYIMFACGPVVPNNSEDMSLFENLLNQVKVFQPNYFILMGPFFDYRNDYLLNCNGGQFFNKIMLKVSLALENINTEAIIIPSIYDLNSYNIFPAPPFENTFAKIQFMPNPSFLNLNGIVMALSSVDIVRHILKEEVSKSSSNKIAKVCEHILNQNSLYPLYPPNNEVNLEYSKLDFITFNVKPHLFLLTSMIKHFALNVEGSIFVNPECLSKGYYSKIKINKIEDENYTGSIEPFTSIEIVKIKKETVN